MASNLQSSPQVCLWFNVNDAEVSKHHQHHLVYQYVPPHDKLLLKCSLYFQTVSHAKKIWHLLGDNKEKHNLVHGAAMNKLS